MRGGCVASMALSALCVAFIIVAYVTGLTQGSVTGVWWSGLLHIAVLLCGLATTWRAWRWLRYRASHSQKRVSSRSPKPASTG